MNLHTAYDLTSAIQSRKGTLRKVKVVNTEAARRRAELESA